MVGAAERPGSCRILSKVFSGAMVSASSASARGVGVGVEGELGALLDDARASGLKKRRAGRVISNGRCGPPAPASSRATSVMSTVAPAHGCEVRSRIVSPVPSRVRSCGSDSGMPERHRAVASSVAASASRAARTRPRRRSTP
jgi:hypothetical protein